MSQFSTLNESSLHNTLKKLYALQTNGKEEVEKFGYIYDVITQNEEIIEIQTQNLSKLYPKITKTIEKGLKIKVVYPIVISKTIILKNNNEEIISKRKSPKKGSIYDIFKELTKIYPILLDENFSLEILKITITETRTQTEQVVQSKNKQRRFLKNWNKTNKKLNEILETTLFSKAEDYLDLLPVDLPQDFSAPILKDLLKKNKLCPARIYNNANLITWVLSHMNLIIQTNNNEKTKKYKINC